jgi:hypothetical protein
VGRIAELGSQAEGALSIGKTQGEMAARLQHRLGGLQSRDNLLKREVLE